MQSGCRCSVSQDKDASDYSQKPQFQSFPCSYEDRMLPWIFLLPFATSISGKFFMCKKWKISLITTLCYMSIIWQLQSRRPSIAKAKVLTFNVININETLPFFKFQILYLLLIWHIIARQPYRCDTQFLLHNSI